MEEDKKEMKEEELKEVSGGDDYIIEAYCPHCKERVDLGDWVCPYCGQRVK